jgi:type IV pilus assembly protein PilO
MTYADEEFLPEGQVETPNYPKAFGITFTPRVGGIVFAVLGLAGAVYLFANVVSPEWERYQTLQSDIATREQEIQNLADIQKKIEAKKAELAQAKQQNQEVLNLFANEKTLNTLLLDLNSIVKSRNGRLSVYDPGSAATGQAADGVINDSSLGAQVNGKLKRKIVNVEVEGSFDQIQSILRSFERLQSLLLVKDFNLTTSDEQVVLVNPESGKAVLGVRDRDNQQKVIPGGKPSLKAKFKLEALMPATPEATDAKPANPTPKPNP